MVPRVGRARAGVTVGGDYTLLGRGSLGRRRRLDGAGGRLGWATPGPHLLHTSNTTQHRHHCAKSFGLVEQTLVSCPILHHTMWQKKHFRAKICVFKNKEEILLFYFPGSCCLTLFSMFVYRLSRTAPKLLFLLEIRTFINNTLLLHNTLHRFSLPTLLLSENWSR